MLAPILKKSQKLFSSSQKLIVDDWEVVKHRKTPSLAQLYDAGKISDKDIHANLGEIVTKKKPGRETETEQIFFSPIGMAIEDVAFSSMIYEQAKREHKGQILNLWKKPLWA